MQTARKKHEGPQSRRLPQALFQGSKARVHRVHQRAIHQVILDDAVLYRHGFPRWDPCPYSPLPNRRRSHHVHATRAWPARLERAARVLHNVQARDGGSAGREADSQRACLHRVGHKPQVHLAAPRRRWRSSGRRRKDS